MRRSIVLALVALLSVLATAAMARVARRPPPPPPGDPKPPATQPTAPASTSVWEPLVSLGGRWVLYGDKTNATVVVEAYDVRTVKGAKVARLRWSYLDGDAHTPLSSSLPSQLAVNKKGVWILTERADDKQVAEALKRKPDMTDPPRPHKDEDGYVRNEGGKVCIGVGQPPGTGKCELGVCHSEYCLQPGVGVASIAGNYAPGGGNFAAPAGAGPGGLPRVGVPACDAFLQRGWNCVASGRLDPDVAQMLRQQLPEWGKGFRDMVQQQGAAAAARQCMDLTQSVDRMFRDWGCP